MQNKENFKNNKQLLFAYSFDEHGVAHNLETQETANELKGDSLTWVHLDCNGNNLNKSKKWLEKEVSYLDHLIIDALLAQETRPRIIEFACGMLIILRSVNQNIDSKPEDMVSIRIWIDHSRIITIQKREMKEIFSLKNLISQGKKIKNSSDFLSSLCNQIGNETSLFLGKVGEKTDIIAYNITQPNQSLDMCQKLQQDLLQLRTQLAIIKRFLKPQKEVFSKLKNIETTSWLDELAKRHFAENQDLINLMIEDIDEAKERTQIMNDEIANTINSKLNRNMFRLSIVTMIFMPITFITGLFGMNLGGIPGKDSESFFIIAGLIIFFAVAEVFLLKKHDWF